MPRRRPAGSFGRTAPPPVPPAPAPPATVPDPNRPVRVFVVEDLDPLRHALALLLDGTPGFACAGVADSAEAALAAEGPPPDVVLLDVGLPGASGLDTIGPLRRRWPGVDVVMLTVLDDAERVFTALRAGATGYLLKSTPPVELLAALREVRDGGAPMTAAIARKVVAHFGAAPGEGDLSPRERDVLDGLMAGLTYRQIGERLFVSPNTVDFHAKRIYAKLHVGGRAEVLARSAGRA